MARPKKQVLGASELDTLLSDREKLKAKIDSHNEAGKAMAASLRDLDKRIEDAEARNRHQILDGVFGKLDPNDRDALLARLQSMEPSTLLAAISKVPEPLEPAQKVVEAAPVA